VEINVVDTIDRDLLRAASTLRSMGKTVIELAPGPDGVARMIDEAIKQAGWQGRITVLRLYAHGNSGAINVAGGKYNEEDTLSTLTLANLTKLEDTLRRLTPYFAPGARVELLGCLVGLGGDGEKFIAALARVWGVRVQASPKELPVGSVQFTGPVYEARPDGGLICVPRTEITREPVPVGGLR